MVEHLGPSYFTEAEFLQIVGTVCSFATNASASIRQAAVYGIGVIAQNSGSAFPQISEQCLTALKNSIDIQIPSKAQAKKVKTNQFYAARDNAIASLGKVIKYHTQYVCETPQLGQNLIQYWLNLLPITRDVEEAQDQYDWVATFILETPDLLLSGNPTESAAQIAKIFGEAFQDKYFKEGSNTKEKIAAATRFMLSGQNADVTNAFLATQQSALNAEAQNRLQAAANY